jgi:hypothetical protein
MTLDAATFFGGNIAPPGQGDGIAWLTGQGGTLNNSAVMGDDTVDYI